MQSLKKIHAWAQMQDPLSDIVFSLHMVVKSHETHLLPDNSDGG